MSGGNILFFCSSLPKTTTGFKPKMFISTADAPAQLAATLAVGEHRKRGEARARRLALQHLRQLRRLRGREAKVDRHVVRLAQLDPLRGALLPEGRLQQPRQRVAVRAPARVG